MFYFSEVITMTNPYIDDLYCHRDSKPPSPYLGEYEEEPVRRRENVLVSLRNINESLVNLNCYV